MFQMEQGYEVVVRHFELHGKCKTKMNGRGNEMKETKTEMK